MTKSVYWSAFKVIGIIVRF